MFFGRVAAVTLTATVTLVGAAAGPVRAQSSEAPSDAPVQVGPLALLPSIGLTNVGYDSNVYNRALDNNPQGDFTAKLSPVVEAWLRLPHARVNGRSELDFYYFKDLTDLRALDTDTVARVDLPLNRLTPFFAGNLTNTRFRQNLEIDAIARRRNDGVTAGANLRLTAKVNVDVYVQRSRLEYQPNSLYLGSDLGHELNHTSAAEGIVLRYALTPFTTFAVEMQRERDRFEFNAADQSNGVLVTPSVEFNPLALVSGRASIGVQRRTFLTGGVPPFNSTTAFADLQYTLLGRTRFGVAAHRDLQYSYIVGVRDYIVTEVDLTVTQRIGESWDVGGTFGRGRLAYTPEITSTNLVIAGTPNETILTSAVDVGYNMGRTRVGFRFEHLARQTDLPVLYRGYERFRSGLTLTHAF